MYRWAHSIQNVQTSRCGTPVLMRKGGQNFPFPVVRDSLSIDRVKVSMVVTDGIAPNAVKILRSEVAEKSPHWFCSPIDCQSSQTIAEASSAINRPPMMPLMSIYYSLISISRVCNHDEKLQFDDEFPDSAGMLNSMIACRSTRKNV